MYSVLGWYTFGIVIISSAASILNIGKNDTTPLEALLAILVYLPIAIFAWQALHQ